MVVVVKTVGLVRTGENEVLVQLMKEAVAFEIVELVDLWLAQLDLLPVEIILKWKWHDQAFSNNT